MPQAIASSLAAILFVVGCGMSDSESRTESPRDHGVLKAGILEFRKRPPRLELGEARIMPFFADWGSHSFLRVPDRWHRLEAVEEFALATRRPPSRLIILEYAAVAADGRPRRLLREEICGERPPTARGSRGVGRCEFFGTGRTYVRWDASAGARLVVVNAGWRYGREGAAPERSASWGWTVARR